MTEPINDRSEWQGPKRFHPLSVPIWGIFLILVFFCLVSVGAAGIKVWLAQKRQDEFAQAIQEAERSIKEEEQRSNEEGGALWREKQNAKEVERRLGEIERLIEEKKEFKRDDFDLSATSEAEKEQKRKATEEETLHQHQKQLELDRERKAARQRQTKIDQQETAAKKLLRLALQLKARGGFDKQVRERLKEIIDKYPDTPSAKEAQRELDKMRE